MAKVIDEFAEKYGIEEGIFDDITDEEYHYGKYRKCLSNSGFKPLFRSAIHFKTWRDRESDIEKDHFTFGKAYHVWLLERHSFFTRFHVVDQITRSTRGGEPTGKWAEVLATAGDKTVLWKKDLVKIQEMADAIPLNKSAEAILQNPGKYERTYIWKDPDYGIWMKCRVDIDIDTIDVIGDLKSTDNADGDAFDRAIFNYGYNFQGAHYVKGATYLTGRRKTFVFLAQEKDPPYAPSVTRLNESDIMIASEKMEPMIQRLAHAFRTKSWESYPHEVRDAMAPRWYV